MGVRSFVRLGGSVVVLLGALAALTGGCGSSSSSTGTTGSSYAKCAGGSGASDAGVSACGQCTMDHCGAEIDACFGGGGACQAWADGACKGIPDATCLTCAQKVTTCQASKCSAECKSTSSDAGSDVGVDTGLPDGAGLGCKDLATCCATLTGDAKTGCDSAVASGVDGTCATVLGSFRTAGLCK